jgi:hypothetical protein
MKKMFHKTMEFYFTFLYDNDSVRTYVRPGTVFPNKKKVIQAPSSQIKKYLLFRLMRSS